MKRLLHIVALSVVCGLPTSLSAETAVEFKSLQTQAWSAVIPVDKNLSPEWEKSLFERGAPRSYSGDALMNIGMPVGGITTGLVYLGGDGKLWNWDIFNRPLNGVKPRQIQYKDRAWHGYPKGLGAWQGGNYVWYGKIPWISSLYIAALKAGEQMALEMGDASFAADCRQRAEKGRAAMDAKLFNGEWFIQIPDPANPKKLGAYETVHIDQVMGQSWVSGFEYHGPKRHIGFAPKLTPENFKAPFTAAQGWGSFSQRIENGKLTAEIDVRHGKLPLVSIALESASGDKLTVKQGDTTLPASITRDGNRVLITLDAPVEITAGEKLILMIQ